MYIATLLQSVPKFPIHSGLCTPAPRRVSLRQWTSASRSVRVTSGLFECDNNSVSSVVCDVLTMLPVKVQGPSQPYDSFPIRP